MQRTVFVASQAHHGDARPHRYDGGDVFFGDVWRRRIATAFGDAMVAFDLGDALLHHVGSLTQGFDQFGLALGFGGADFFVEYFEPTQGIAQRRGRRTTGHADPCRGFVDQVNGFVGQKAVGHIA